jgi:hypothetical protein
MSLGGVAARHRRARENVNFGKRLGNGPANSGRIDV